MTWQREPFLERLQIETGGAFHCHAFTADLQALVERSGGRRLRDIESFFLGLAPPKRPWLHNDLHLRQGIPPDEPRNAQAHPIAMVLGNQLSLPVVDGRLGIGRWQSVLLVELDGPRRREVLLQLIDTGGPSNQHAEVLVCSGYREPKVNLELLPQCLDQTPVMRPSGAPQKNPAKPGWMKWVDQAANEGKPEAIG